MIGLILGEFGHSVSEMKWFKSEFNKEISKGKPNSWGHNNLDMIIDKDFCKIGNEIGTNGMQKISTELIKRYVDESIIFLDKYYSNGIPGLELKIK